MAAPKILGRSPARCAPARTVRDWAALAVKELVRAEADVTRISLADYPLPLYDADLEPKSGPPHHALQLKRLVAAHHGVLIVNPGIQRVDAAAPKKHHRLDIARARPRRGAAGGVQASRVRAWRRVARSCGGMRALLALRQVLELGCGALVIPEQIAVPRADHAFDDMDNLEDEGLPRRSKRWPGRWSIWRATRQASTRPGPGAGDGARRGLRGAAQAMQREPRERLIVALDVSSVEAAQALVTRLGDAVSFYKIGYQLAFAGGLDYAQTLVGSGKRVFVDLKLHDIGNTVAQGVKSVARLGATFLTVHAYPETMKAAVDARQGDLRILAVTVLTSYNDQDLEKPPATTPRCAISSARRAEQARVSGVDGSGLLARGGRNGARDRRHQARTRHTRHPAGGRRGRRPEAEVPRRPRRSPPVRIISWSGGRSSRRRSAGGGASHRRRNRTTQQPRRMTWPRAIGSDASM